MYPVSRLQRRRRIAIAKAVLALTVLIIVATPKLEPASVPEATQVALVPSVDRPIADAGDIKVMEALQWSR